MPNRQTNVYTLVLTNPCGTPYRPNINAQNMYDKRNFIYTDHSHRKKCTASVRKKINTSTHVGDELLTKKKSFILGWFI